MKRICLWSGPRNISTALMYSFAQRPDTIVFDEPLYAAYLTNHDAKEYHPGAAEILGSMDQNPANVIEMMLGPHPKPLAFFKQMTHHLVDLDWTFLQHTVNIILTRDPIEMLPSYAHRIYKPTMQDVGYALHFDLLNYLQSIGQNPIIIDSKNILLNPEHTLRTLCQKIDLSFDDKMLTWEKGARQEDGIWAKYWYQSVHDSTGFHPYKQKTDPFPDHLEPLLEKCLPLYEKLSALSIH